MKMLRLIEKGRGRHSGNSDSFPNSGDSSDERGTIFKIVRRWFEQHRFRRK